MLLARLGEDTLIEALANSFASKGKRLLKGIGDDTCVARQKGGMALLATTDSLIEGTHFTRATSPGYLLGRKALSISLSDIAAMGGEPMFFLVSLSLTPDTTKRFIDDLYRGLGDVARETGCMLAGGNTARTTGKMAVSTTVLGEAPCKKVIYRKGARTGDLVFVTGTVGSSALGLRALALGPKARARYSEAIKRHLDPTPRLAAGRALAKACLATAMMDISDGVAIDLKRMCLESKKAAVINLSSLPVSAEFRSFCERRDRGALVDLALTGGEDYELIFTSPETNLGRVSALSRRLALPMTPIGRIIAPKKTGRVITVIGDNGGAIELDRLGFEHF